MTGTQRGAARANVDHTARYHVTPERNWMNDPNGPIHWNGRYHLFFQANPVAPYWSRPHWGHVSSTDLARWTRHPIALAPDDDGPDRDGCWSGCSRNIDGVPTIFYTGIVGDGDNRQESVCRAWGTADLGTWTKDPTNPIIPGPPPTLGTGYHRDPFLWREDGQWRMILGSGLPDGPRTRGAVLEYRSADLENWHYTGVFHSDTGPAPDGGQLWECPQLVTVDGQTILIISLQDPDRPDPMLGVVAVHGDVQDGHFSERFRHTFDYGDLLYAPAVTRDDHGRWLLWGWIREPQPPAALRPSDKVGALSLPRILAIRDGRLITTPADGLTALRRRALPFHTSTDGASTSGSIDDAIPQQLEVALELRRAFGRADLMVRSIGSDHGFRISADEATSVLTLEDLAGDTTTAPLRAPLPGGDEQLGLRLFLDGSIIEAFALGGAITSRRYCAPSSLSYTVTNREAVIRAEAWQLSDDAV